MTGGLVLPADPSYGIGKQLYNEKFDDIDPAAIAYCESVADVQRCIAFARDHDVGLTTRAGGHSYGGYSSCPGLVIDVTRMNDVTVALGSTTAIIGAGSRLIDIYNSLGNEGVLLPGGSCPTVGIAGLALGGGIGVFGRLFGLTCDNIVSFDVVTADSRLLTADAQQNEDLFWASRGGGGGNFGVTTSFTFKVHPIPPITLFTLIWPWAAATQVLGSWLSWSPESPDAMWSNCQLLSGGPSGLELRVTGVYAGTTAACTAALEPLLRATGPAPSSEFVGPEQYLNAMLIEAGCEGSTVAQCHLPSQSPSGTLTRSAFNAKSAYLSAALPSAGIEAVVEAVIDLSQSLPSVGGGVVFDAYGGAIARTGAADTAFVHRDAISAIEYSFNWAPGVPQSVITQGDLWLAKLQQSLAPYSAGSYVNYIDPTLANWQQAYYGANLPRLASVKKSVDPDDTFHFAQSIPVSLDRP